MTFVRRNATATDIETGERQGTGEEQNVAGEMATYQLNLKSSCKEAGRCVQDRAAAVDEMRVRQGDNNKKNCKNNGNIKARKKSNFQPVEDFIPLEALFLYCFDCYCTIIINL